MKKIAVLFLFVAFTVSCNAQKENSTLIWKNFDFSDAGINISMPCEPSKSVKIFQEKPKLAQVYQFNCEEDNLKFSITLSERFEDFEPNKTKEKIDGIEKFIREGVKDKATVSAKDLTFQTFAARQFDVINETSIARHLHIQNERGAYNIQLILKRKPNQLAKDMNAEFESVAPEYFDSLKISDIK